MINIFDTDITFEGQDVYIVGMGPNAPVAFPLIPPGAITIGLNKAAIKHYGEFEQPPISWWLCTAPGLLNEQWFKNAMSAYPIVDGIIKMKPIFIQGPLTKAYPDIPYYIPEGLSFHQGPMGIVDGLVRRGAGSCGCALQLAYQKKAKRCILVGIDMCGKGYWDGTANETKGSIHPDGTWTQLPMLQRLIDWCKANGMDVASMTETKLNVEMV